MSNNKTCIRRSASKRGFTLIELMIVAAIIGILASIAIPVFRNYLLKSKGAERDLLVSTFERALLQQIAERDRFPNVSGTTSFIAAPDNPPTPMSTMKRDWSPDLGDWRYILGQPVGGTYFTYRAVGEVDPTGFSYFWVEAESDLDSDGVPALVRRAWYHSPGVTRGWEPWFAMNTDPVPSTF